MSQRARILCSLLTGILLSPAWYSWGSGLFLLVAFIPLLFVTEDLAGSVKRSPGFFWYPFLAFLTWNIITTWWIKNASFAGLIAALAVNTSLMALTFWLFTVTRRKLPARTAYLALLFYWLAFEYLYLNAEISWTWLNLGNGFANNIRLIQYYEYTGVLGGSAWVLVANLLIFQIIRKRIAGGSIRSLRPRIGLLVFILLAPPLISLSIFTSYREKPDPHKIVILQPNIDPYQKFNDIPSDEQMRILLLLADSLADQETDYIVAPETFLNNNVWLDKLEFNQGILELRNFMSRYPGAKFVIGATTYRAYNSPAEATPTAQRMGDYFYDSFNTALQIDSTRHIPYYHKSQLVVGVEKMPYTEYLGFLRNMMLHLGGTFRSHGTQDYRDAFTSPQDGTNVGPVICYESIFGEFVTEYVSEAGANFIFVITNDGWWGDTPGYVQHNSFSSIRAIENRRSIARSANTGISSFINQRGEILNSVGWWKRGGLTGELNANDYLTFYTRHGDYIGRIASFAGILVLLYTLVISITGRVREKTGRHPSE
jgi:apolipoprotein N-acyltransferase